MIERRAARALVVTPDRHVLLMKMAFPWLSRAIWIAPGGGLQRGETWEAAALRELQEETGFLATGIGPQLWERTLHIEHKEQITRLHERYFVVRARRFEPGSARLEAQERGWFRGFRWWPLSELAKDDSVELGCTLQAVITPVLQISCVL